MCKATPPIDLLRELRAGFEHEAGRYRDDALNQCATEGERRVLGAKAFAAEQAVKKIDATLRDWA